MLKLQKSSFDKVCNLGFASNASRLQTLTASLITVFLPTCKHSLPNSTRIAFNNRGSFLKSSTAISNLLLSIRVFIVKLKSLPFL